ncbi:MAG: TatD family hydrolase, partial [Helicobacter sp.]|nr:TatD family hydrolase [Helicobacter sp.]
MMDTHCHLDDAGYTDCGAILHAAQQQGVSRFIIPAADPKDLARAREISHAHDCVYFAVGVHPNCADAYDEALLRSYITDSRCVAVGECGLDYYRLESHNAEATKEKQKEVFAAQI